MADTAGYEELALVASEQALEIQKEGGPSDGPLLVFSRYQDAAAVAFQHAFPEQVIDQPGRGRPNQWDVWAESEGRATLFVSLGPCADAPCEAVHTHEVTYRGKVIRRYVFYPCSPPSSQVPWRRPGTQR